MLQIINSTIITKIIIDIIDSGAYKMLPTTVSLVSWIPGIYSDIDGTIIIRIKANNIKNLCILCFYRNFMLSRSFSLYYNCNFYIKIR